MSGKKYYVVWKGKNEGVFNSWETCKNSVEGFEGAKFKSFDSYEEALEAFGNKRHAKYFRKNAAGIDKTKSIIRNSLAVDAACSGNPGQMEYRGVFVNNKEELFHAGPFEKGTNNIGEFLAIVHGLAYLKQRNSDLPLYSDSANAILWVKKKKCKTKLQKEFQNKKIFDLIKRAEIWLEKNTYTTEIIKWETSQWGEIPADFGRK